MSGEPPKDLPIDPPDYFGGVNVVDIGDVRVPHGMSRRPFSSCRHRQRRYDHQERRIWCADCEQNIKAFDAIEHLVEQFSNSVRQIGKRSSELAEAEKFQARTLAAHRLDIS
jgi:hypothetical protein